MELKQVLGRRRTIRFFLPFRQVERSKIQKMLEAARRASCVGNVNNTRAIVIWKDQASPELIKNITPPLGYQQMQTAPVFILWYHDKNAYEITKWVRTCITSPSAASARTSGDQAEIDRGSASSARPGR
jgi:nitroreductase